MPAISYQQNGSNVNLTGSPNYLASIKVTGDPGSGCSSDQYKQFNTEAYSGPGYFSIGNESGANLLRACNLNFWDFAISRNITLGGGRICSSASIFSTPSIPSCITLCRPRATFNSPATPTTVTNSQYNADGSLNTGRIRPETAGFGAANGAWPSRTAQFQVRVAVLNLRPFDMLRVVPSMRSTLHRIKSVLTPSMSC